MEFRLHVILYQDRELQTLSYCITDFYFLYIQNMKQKCDCQKYT